jgi:hypothetical protein
MAPRMCQVDARVAGQKWVNLGEGECAAYSPCTENVAVVYDLLHVHDLGCNLVRTRLSMIACRRFEDLLRLKGFNRASSITAAQIADLRQPTVSQQGSLLRCAWRTDGALVPPWGTARPVLHSAIVLVGLAGG